jgi:hypothetical protein
MGRMRDLKKQERTAIEAVARRFSATWEKGSDPPDAYIMVAGKRVAVDITTLKRRGTGQGNAAKPRLRFDKVATRLIERRTARRTIQAAAMSVPSLITLRQPSFATRGRQDTPNGQVPPPRVMSKFIVPFGCQDC